MIWLRPFINSTCRQHTLYNVALPDKCLSLRSSFVAEKLKDAQTIAAQSVSKDCFDEDAAIEDEEIQSNIASAMFKFQKDMFQETICHIATKLMLRC